MKLKHYIKLLQEIDANNKYLDLEVVYASDEEGNSFHELNFVPSLGDYDGGEFVTDDGSKEFKKNFMVNAVCIN